MIKDSKYFAARFAHDVLERIYYDPIIMGTVIQCSLIFNHIPSDNSVSHSLEPPSELPISTRVMNVSRRNSDVYIGNNILQKL